MLWYQGHDVAAAPITCDDPVVLQFHLAQIAASLASLQVQTFGVQDDTHDIEDHFVDSFLGFLHAIYASCKQIGISMVYFTAMLYHMHIPFSGLFFGNYLL